MSNHFGVIEVTTLGLAIWGSFLSTFLGVLKAREFWKERFRIDVGVMLTSSVDLGNTVTIRNLGGKPVIVEYWELVWRSGWWPRRKESLLDHPGSSRGTSRLLPAPVNHCSSRVRITSLGMCGP